MKNEAEIIELDIRGQVCPSSLLLVLREINNRNKMLMAGQCQIVVSTDNRDATGTIPATVANMGLFAKVRKVDDFYQIQICKEEVE